MSFPTNEYLRRKCNKPLYLQIKQSQKTLSRFQAAVKFEISLVTIRFAFASSSYEEFKARVKRGLVSQDGDAYSRIKTVVSEVRDSNFEEERWGFNSMQEV